MLVSSSGANGIAGATGGDPCPHAVTNRRAIATAATETPWKACILIVVAPLALERGEKGDQGLLLALRQIFAKSMPGILDALREYVRVIALDEVAQALAWRD